MSEAPQRAPSRLSTMAALALVAALASGLSAWLVVWATAPARVHSEVVTTVHATPAVVSAVRSLARLEAVSFHMERVLDVRDRQAHLFGLFESEDAVLLVAAADVIAGVDLALMREDDLQIDPGDGTVRVVLPPPIILSSRLDTENTYVHTRRTDALARPGRTLETRARQEAEQSLREAALDAGILQRARENTERTVRTLLSSLGARRVEVRFRSEL